MSNAGEKASLNLTDNDSPIMKGKKGNFDTYYNVQAACGEDQIITYCEVVLSGNDKAQLVPALKGIVQNTGKTVDKALADADYGNLNSFEYMEQNNIDGYVPYQYMNTTYEDKPFHATHFSYDKEKDVYCCPNDELLEFYRIRIDKNRQQEFRCYRTNACKQCPFQKQCCKPKSVRRVIERETRQELRDQMKQKLNSADGQKIYQKRLHPIESIFGQLKYNLKYTHFLLRGLEKVKAEFTLMCLTHNLRKMIDYFARFLPFWSHLSAFRSQKNENLTLPRNVNELNPNTLNILLILLNNTNFLKVFICFHSRSPCVATLKIFNVAKGKKNPSDW